MQQVNTFMEKDIFANIISGILQLDIKNVTNTISLIDEGCTIPFMSRYRKERTGGLDEVQIGDISDLYEKFREMSKRKETILNTISELGKLTPELETRINNCWDSTELEDIYLPYRPKRRTKAQLARENGLEPLALLIMAQNTPRPELEAAKFAKGNVKTTADAIRGAQDIIAEMVSEDQRSRNLMRAAYRRDAMIFSKVAKGKDFEEGSAKYSDYFDFSEPLNRCTSHRYLAMRRGEEEGVLRVSIGPDNDRALDRLKRNYLRGDGICTAIVDEAVEDAYNRLLTPSISNEFAADCKSRSDDEAIAVFGENLRQLLLSAPLGQKRVMGIDPGFRTGCKVVCLDEQGQLLHHEAIFPHPPVHRTGEAEAALRDMTEKYRIEAIAIGNGTASRETERFVKGLHLESDPQIFVVSEDGASIYSASKTAREEFPREDVTVRGAVSIARRLMDPLAELVKIDPKSIGVGQYQHDVDQSKLKKRLDATVESCVNLVGVNLNTASVHLLQYVSGLGATLARNIVKYRSANGPFTDRAQLLKVPRLGPAAFRQCAGFLRISGAANPLDNSSVHPESYGVVEKMAADCGCTVAELMADRAKRDSIVLENYVDGETGMPTLVDIMKELEKPGRDPRNEIEEFAFAEGIEQIEDLQVGMVLPGIVSNITNFGAFVDIGVHQDGLVHISKLTDRFVSDPMQVVHLHQHVMVRVIDVDLRRRRIALSMRDID